MAALALRAFFAAVNVLARMTAHALAGDVGKRRREVALRTRDAGVRATQRERRRRVIEENTAAPSAFVMTMVAARPFSAMVDVLVSMAGVTVGVEALGVQLAAVTVRAADLGMPSAQRVASAPIMFEGRPPPIARRVAGLTCAAKLSVVAIIAFVTTVARRRRMLRSKCGGMTFFTRSADVPPEQREVCPARVIESGRRPLAWAVA